MSRQIQLAVITCATDTGILFFVECKKCPGEKMLISSFWEKPIPLLLLWEKFLFFPLILKYLKTFEEVYYEDKITLPQHGGAMMPPSMSVRLDESHIGRYNGYNANNCNFVHVHNDSSIWCVNILPNSSNICTGNTDRLFQGNTEIKFIWAKIYLPLISKEGLLAKTYLPLVGKEGLFGQDIKR